MSEIEQVVREFYSRIAVEDVAGIIELMSDQIIWTIPGPPAIPYAGTFRGKEGVATFFRILLDHEDLRSFAPDEFVTDESLGFVCVLGSEEAVAIKTRKRFSTKWVEVFRVRDGLIVSFEEHIDTFALAEAYSLP